MKVIARIALALFAAAGVALATTPSAEACIAPVTVTYTFATTQTAATALGIPFADNTDFEDDAPEYCERTERGDAAVYVCTVPAGIARTLR